MDVTANSNFSTLSTSVQSDISVLTTKRSTLNSVPVDAKAKIGSANFVGWEDSVSSQMQLLQEEHSSSKRLIQHGEFL